jgi:hypothetical protein
MKNKWILLITVFTLAFAGVCRSSQTNDLDAFVKACLSSSNLNESMCKCLAGKADERLSPEGFAFLVASMNKDKQKTQNLRSKLDMAEAMAAGMFMVNTPQECAQQ